MKTVGFPISQKKNEQRRCLIPSDAARIKNKSQIFVEEGYGKVLNYSDDDYVQAGVNVVSQEDVLSKDIICDAKIGDAAYLSKLKDKTIFGWIHAVQNRDITELLINNKLTAYAWEDMFEGGRHTFWRNNEIAGEAAVLNAYALYGALPYDTNVALLGRGNIARGAMKVLTCMGANVSVYDRKTEALLSTELEKYDVVVNAILWDSGRTDHILYNTDLKRMKKGAMIIDISCDNSGAIESSYPTKIDDPVYIKEGVLHYSVDHTPSIFYKSTSNSLSEQVTLLIDMLIEEKPSKELMTALIFSKGEILDERIISYQKR